MSNVMELLSKNIGELFDYLETYKNRLEEKREIENAQNLIYTTKITLKDCYLTIPQGLDLLEYSEGLGYQNMGTMENHV